MLSPFRWPPLREVAEGKPRCERGLHLAPGPAGRGKEPPEALRSQSSPLKPSFVASDFSPPLSERLLPLSTSLLSPPPPATKPWTRLQSLALGACSLPRSCSFFPTSKNDGPGPVLLNAEGFSCGPVSFLIKAGGKERASICAQISPTLRLAHLIFLLMAGTWKCLPPTPARSTLDGAAALQNSARGAPAHPALQSRRAETPGASLTRTRRLQSGRGAECVGTAQKAGKQGRGTTYGHPGRDTEGQWRRAASAAPASGEPRSGSWLTAGPGEAGPERRAARRQEHGVGPGLYRALMQEALGVRGGGRRPGSPAALCVFSPPRRPLYAPGPTRGW